jgi:hypothetical protein
MLMYKMRTPTFHIQPQQLFLIVDSVSIIHVTQSSGAFGNSGAAHFDTRLTLTIAMTSSYKPPLSATLSCNNFHFCRLRA